jgi:L-ascorbate metabolism protein UlaG (beta-lactamase superfamily)
VQLHLTHIGTATVLLEVGDLRLLTDPAFDPAGSHYSWAPFGADSTKLEAPALSAGEVGSVDAALVSHAQHDDNLDPSGRELLGRAERVLTTRPSARRLGGKAEGLAPGETTELVGRQGQRVRVTATPARHGPPLSLPFVGRVIGFLLEWEVPEPRSIYISGDTVLFGGLRRVARRSIDLAILHMGQAKLPVTGPFRLTMNGRQAARLSQLLGARVIVPVHYDGWTHFSEPVSAARRGFAEAGLDDRVRWLRKGERTRLEV